MLVGFMVQRGVRVQACPEKNKWAEQRYVEILLSMGTGENVCGPLNVVVAAVENQTLITIGPDNARYPSFWLCNPMNPISF